MTDIKSIGPRTPYRVEYKGGVGYAWLDITEVNVAYFKGQKDVAIFERQLNMGGPIPTKVNKALFLDEYGDYVDCGDAANNSLDIGTNATVELWVNFDSLPAANDLDTFVSKDEGGGSTNKWIFGYAQSYGHVSNQLFWHINTPGGYSDWVVSSSWIPSTGRWYHIAVVKSGSNYIFYKDGVQHGTDSTTIAVPDVNYNLLIGRAEGKFDFNGNIDEVRIFSIARTQEEIQANMNQPIKNPELQLNLVGYWNFDNGTANDSSSYGNHGTLMGDADIIPLVGTWPPPLRGDVSGNGQITAYDAALILQYVVGLIDEFPAERMSSPSAIEPHNYEISLPDVETPAGKRFQVPIAINDATGLSAGGITIKYDSTVLRAISYGSLELLNGYYWKANTNIQGEVRFAFATTEPTPALDPEQSEGEGKGQGNLLMVEFEVLPNTEGKTSSLVLDNVNLSNSLTITKINGSVKVIPSSFALLQNYPNPFNPDTWLPFKLAKEALVTIQIYNTKGQLIRTIALSNKPAGVYITKDKAAYWDGRDSLGEKVASGVYYYTLRAGGFMATRKMVIMK